MSKFQNSIIELGENFNSGHFMAIAGCAVFLIAMTFVKNGFHLWPAAAVTSQPVLTYEQAKSEVAMEMGRVPQVDTDSGNQQNQIALLDPSLDQGQVLGASTDASGLFPPAETVFTPDVLGKIKINLLKDSNADLIQAYVTQVTGIEANAGVLGIMTDLNSEDPATLSSIPSKTNGIIQQLAKIPVPSELAEYNRLKMVYYNTLGNLATNLSGKQGVSDTDNATTLFFSISERLDKIKTDIFNKYNITL